MSVGRHSSIDPDIRARDTSRRPPSVAVVIPAYDAAAWLAEAIESVLAQSMPPDEIVVVDDGSGDDTSAVAQRFAGEPTLRLIRQTNSGLVAARNRGLDELGDGVELVLFLDADDVLHPSCIERLVRALDEQADAVGAYGLPSFFVDGDPIADQPIDETFGADRIAIDGRRLRSVPHGEPTTFDTVVVWIPIATAGQLLVRRDVLMEVGAFCPAVPIGEDWDAWLRLTTAGPLAFVREIVMYKRAVLGSLSSSGKRLAVAEPLIRRRLQTLPIYTPAQRAAARHAEVRAELLRFRWARDLLRQGDYRNSARNAARGTQRVARLAARRLARLG